MTKKKERKLRAREIRKGTGLSLPVSMYLARVGADALYTVDGAGATAVKASEALAYQVTGCPCCQGELEITGPRGTIPAYA